MSARTTTLSASKLAAFCSEILTRAGLAEDLADIVSDSILCAELRGIKSHGLIRLETYLQRSKAGVMNIKAPVTIERDEEATALLNANNGLGQIAGHRAMTLAIDKAKKYGAAVVAVKNSNHFGIAAYYSMMALPEDMIGCVFTNSSPAMAVYGTKTPLIGTNPLSIALPAGNHHFPIVLDMSTTVVARGKIRYAALKGDPIPLGWARDKDGRPTQDAKLALEGSLDPIAGPKGSAMSLIIDIICGILTNTVLTGGVKNITDVSGPALTGHLFAALNIARFIDVGLFKANVDLVVDNIKSQPAVEGTEVFLPGEIEALCATRLMKEGFSLDGGVLASLNRVAARYGVTELSPG